MTPEIQAVKERLETERQHAAGAEGSIMVGGGNGPASFTLVERLLAVVEAQQREIEVLKRKTEDVVDPGQS